MIVAAVVFAGVLGAVVLADEASAEGDTYTINYQVGEQVLAFTGTEPQVALKSLEELGVELPEGQVMKGWQEQGTSSIVAEGSIVTLAAGVPKTFVAVTDTAEITVTFVTLDDQGREVIDTYTYAYGAEIVAPEIPAREGYVIEGWSPEVPETAVADGTYYAQYREIYTVAWVVDGTVIAVGDSTDAESINLPADPYKESYEFLGWFDAAGVQYTVGYVFEADTVFTAQFRADDCTVTYKAGDQVVYTTSIPYGTLAPKIEIASGWEYWDFDFSQAITADTVINAAKHTYTVTFVAGDFKQTVSVLWGDTIASDKVPAVPSGYDRWDYDFSKAVTGDVTIQGIATPAKHVPFYEQTTWQVVIFVAVCAVLFLAYAIYTDMGGIKTKLTSRKGGQE